MANGIRTGDPCGFNKGRSSKFCEGSRVLWLNSFRLLSSKYDFFFDYHTSVMFEQE